MARVARSLIVGAVVAAAIFLGSAFSAWSLNPADWNDLDRQIAGLLMTFFGIGAFAASMAAND